MSIVIGKNIDMDEINRCIDAQIDINRKISRRFEQLEKYLALSWNYDKEQYTYSLSNEHKTNKGE